MQTEWKQSPKTVLNKVLNGRERKVWGEVPLNKNGHQTHLPFSLRALFQAELKFSHLVLLRGVKIILRGEGEVGRFEQVAPCERKECKLEKKEREVERKRALVFLALWVWRRRVTKRTENISARVEKLQFRVQCKDMSTLAELVKDGSRKLFALSAFTTDLCLSFSYWGRFIASSLGRMWMNTLQMEVENTPLGFEAPANPWSHRMRLGGPEVNVQDDHGDTDAGDHDDDCDHKLFEPEGVEDHGEEDKLAKEGDNEGGGRDDLGQEEEEHRQGEQDGDGQGDLVLDRLID